MDAATFWLMHAGIVGASAVVLLAVATWGRRVLLPDQDGVPLGAR
jgi:hypothetical protein